MRWRLLLVLVVVAGAVSAGCSSDLKPGSSDACEAWIDRVDAGDEELTPRQETVVRATLAIPGQSAADALAFEAPELCLAARVLGLIGSDGSVSPLGLYLVDVCKGEENPDWGGCRHLERVSEQIAERAED